MPRLTIFVVAILALLQGCTFQPEGDSLTEIEVPPPTSTDIDFFESQDTILVRGDFSASATAKTSERIQGYRVLVDDKVVQDIPQPPATIHFNSGEFSDGIHTVTMEITKYRKGESMAAQLGVEVYTQSYSRKIRTYNKPLPTPKVTTSIKDGMLTLQWEPYLDPGFVQYTLNSTNTSLHASITDQKQGSVSLPDFIGGKADFTFSLTAFKETVQTTFSYEAFYEAEIEKTETGVKYTWAESPFVNCAGFKVTLDNSGQLQEFEYGNESKSVELPAAAIFPYDIAGKIHVMGSHETELLLKDRTYSSMQPFSGVNVGIYEFKQLIKHPTIDSLLLIHYVEETFGSSFISLHSRKTGKLIATAGGVMGVSPNGLHLFRRNESGNIAQLDPTNLSEKGNSVLYRNITGTNGLWQFSVSNDNKMLFYADYPTTTDKYYGYDWNTKTILYTTTPGSGGIERAGSLGIGGLKFYNRTANRVVSLDTDPTTSYLPLNLDANKTMSHIDRHVILSGRRLSVYALPLSELYFVTLPQSLSSARLFNNQDNELGIAYALNGNIMINFFDLRDLRLITTLETRLPAANMSRYVFALIQNELFVYLTENYGQLPIHTIKLNF